MKKVEEILAEIDEQVEIYLQKKKGPYEDSQGAEALYYLKQFILSPSTECEHEWHEYMVDHTLSIGCRKCGATK